MGWCFWRVLPADVVFMVGARIRGPPGGSHV